MVFGWGKKKTEPIPETIPLEKEIPLSEVKKITVDLLNLRTKQTVSEIKSYGNSISPLIKELVSIANTLEKDDLKVDDIDKHLRTIVVRGKKQVIDVIKKDGGSLPEISSFDDALNLDVILNQKLKKIGDVLGRQTRVIHIFAKKYAQKLKEILSEMNSSHNEIKKLIKNYQDTKFASDEIAELLTRINNFENDSVIKNKQISEYQNTLDSFQSEIKKVKDSIEKIKSAEKYREYLKLKQSLSSFNDTKNQIKNEIESQFTKISRALSRYEYVSSLDKEQKSLLSGLINDPIQVLKPQNKDSIILIFENIRKGILSGSISVKDVEKTSAHLTETEESLGGFIKKISAFEENKKAMEKQLLEFDDPELSRLERNLEKILTQKGDLESKISSHQKDINENSTNIPKMIVEIEKKLKRFSNTAYTITQST